MRLTRLNCPKILLIWLDELNDMNDVFINVMALKRNPPKGIHKLTAYLYVAWAYAKDVWANHTLMVDIFRDPAAEWTCTARFKRYKKNGTPEQMEAAKYLCNILSREDPDGHHC